MWSAGNQNYQIEVVPGVSHALMPAKTGCLSENSGTSYVREYLEILEEWLQHQLP
jgi:hypothetical protein